ncbi:hypothetical protein [Methanolobus sp. WCC5]|uniref:hypothetical protein n=1 Tax=Methanolobus sp. WCC5 TaxID=3125785 RepID=UPI003248D047
MTYVPILKTCAICTKEANENPEGLQIPCIFNDEYSFDIMLVSGHTVEDVVLRSCTIEDDIKDIVMTFSDNHPYHIIDGEKIRKHYRINAMDIAAIVEREVIE